MLDEEIRNTVLNILNTLPSEGPCLDYKQGYPKNKKAEFIKDVCGFLNSIDGLNKDKFIIVGVKEEEHCFNLDKINWNLWMKDDEIQGLMDKISPRPTIISDIIKLNGEDYGYVYIPGNINADLVYTINADYPVMSQSDPEFSKTKFVYATTSFIRRGSTIKPLLEEERRKIYKLINSKIDKDFKDTDVYFGSVKENEILKKLSLIGSWDDSNKNDCIIVSKYINTDIDYLRELLKTLLKTKPELITYKKNVWNIEKREEIIKEFSEFIHTDDIEEFEKIVLEVDSFINPKYDLEKGKRQFANWYGKFNKYSDNLRHGLMDCLLLLKNNYDLLINCKHKIRNLEFNLISKIAKPDDWKSLISSSDLLTYLAEFGPNSYIDFIEEVFKNKEVIKTLNEESEENLVRKEYISEVIRGLTLTIQLDEYFIRSSVLLIKISEYDNSIIDSLTTIMLPWFPQTVANMSKRIIAIKTMYKHSRKMTIELIKKLLPGKTMNSYEVQKFRHCYSYDFENPTYEDIYNEEKELLKLLFEKEKNNVDIMLYILDDITHMGGLLFDYVIDNLKNILVENADHEFTFKIWNELKNINIRFEKYHSDPKEEDLRKHDILNNLEKDLHVDSFDTIRYFNENEWLLEDEFEGNHDSLKNNRKKIVSNVYNKYGINELINVSKNSKNSFEIGYTLSELGILPISERSIIYKNLDNYNQNVINMSCGFVSWQIKNNKNLNIEEIVKDLNNAQKTNFYLQMPNNFETWESLLKNLKFPKTYWTKNFIRFVNTSDELNYAAKMKLKYKSYSDSLEILYCGINDKMKIDMDIAYECLEGLLNNQDKISNAQYTIKDIISYLQRNKYDENKLFNIEWSYMKLFDEECEPITIKKVIAKKPEIFIELISLCYKKHSEEKKILSKAEESIAENAYYVLDKCKVVPGCENGAINNNKFSSWIKKARQLAKKNDRLEITEFLIGKMLFYCPEDKDGLWIDKNIATFLNKEDNMEFRKGYNNEAFNSIGVINYDGTGSVYDNLAEQYKLKAEELYKYSYDVFAKSILNLSDSLKLDAEHEREGF